MSSFISRMFRDLIVNGISSSSITPLRIRYLVYKWYGIDISTKSVSPQCFFGGTRIKIGNGTFINYKVWFDCNEQITIGNNCDIGLEVMFITSNHEVSSESRRAGKLFGEPIVVGDGCWIGSRVTVLPGVNIGQGCIIAAGSVVNNDCKPNSLYAGVPAVWKKDLPID